MNIKYWKDKVKYWINKWFESGWWCQILLFTIANCLVFGVSFGIYHFFGYLENIKLWETLRFWESLRLFISSNGILLFTDGKTFHNVWLLVIECLGKIFFAGFIISIITNLIRRKVEAIKEGHVHYNLRNHVVIIGYDTIVPSVISELIKSPIYAKSKIVLQTSSSVDDIRNDLLSKLSQKELKRVILIHAPRLSVEEMELLYTPNAKEIFIVGEREQNDHDAENMHTFEALVTIHKKKECKESKSLTIWFENEASYAALQLNDISSEWKQYFEFKPYNFYKRWANRLLTNSDYGTGIGKIVYPELDHEGITENSSKHVHLIIVGMNRMGIALAKEAAHMMHFPNFNEDTGKNRTRITFIDDHADREKDFFIGRHAGYFERASILYADMTENSMKDFPKKKDIKKHFLDVQFEFIKGRVESKNVRDWMKEQLKDKDAIVTIAICLHNPSQSFGMAMYLPEEVYTRGRNNWSKPWEVVDKDKVVNIFVRQERTGSLIKAFGDTAKSADAMNKKYANLYPFGMIDDSFSIDYYSNHLAMAFNYTYDFYFAHNETLPESIPSVDELIKKWKHVTTSNKWSNLYLADSLEFKLRSIGLDFKTATQAELTDEQVDKMAYTEHCRWNMEKLLLGYRPLNDDDIDETADVNILKKHVYAHHLIKPYKHLTDGQKQLDKNIIKKLPDIISILNR